MVDITGLKKHLVLKALYDAASPIGFGVLVASPGDMPSALALQFVQDAGSLLYFDYVYGRPLKVDITKNAFDPALYDRDHGQGTAERVIAPLRRQKELSRR